MTRRWGYDCVGGAVLTPHIPNMVENGLSFAFVRAGEGYYTVDNFPQQIDGLRANGVPFGLYWAIHPWKDPTMQVAQFLAQAAHHNPACLALDMELYWEPEMTSSQINAVYRQALDVLQARWPHQVVNYTGPWFIRDHCPEMREWIGLAPTWFADYAHVIFTPQSWPEFKTMVSNIPWQYDADIPPMKIFQFEGTTVTPMVPHGLDYSIIDNDAVYNAVFRGAVMPPIEPPPTVPPGAETWMVASGIEHLTVRTGPGVTYSPAPYQEWLKGVIPGEHPIADRVVITSKSPNNWGMFAPYRWVSLSKMVKVL